MMRKVIATMMSPIYRFHDCIRCQMNSDTTGDEQGMAEEASRGNSRAELAE